MNRSPITLEELERTVPSAFALERHASRSDRYTYIPTVDIITAMQKHGFMPFAATQSTTKDEDRQDFTKHMIRFRLENQLNVGDSLPEVVLINSHDGTSAYKLFAGLFRLVCSNGMIIAESMIGEIRVPHKGNIVDAVIEGSFKLADHSADVLSTVKDWQQLQLGQSEQLALAEASHHVRFSDGDGKVETPITAAQLLQPRRAYDAGSDLWHTFNRIQENVLKGGLHGTRVVRDSNRQLHTRRVSTREIKGIDQDIRLNRALWTLAAKMAEIKHGNEQLALGVA